MFTRPNYTIDGYSSFSMSNTVGCFGNHFTLQWRHNGHDSFSNKQPDDFLLSHLFRRRSQKTKLRVTGLCVGNSPVTGEFPAQRASNAEHVSIRWRHREWLITTSICSYQKLSKIGCRCIYYLLMMPRSSNEWQLLKQNDTVPCFIGPLFPPG